MPAPNGATPTPGEALVTGHPVELSIDAAHVVSGLLFVPPRPRALYVMAHGAGAGMTHPFMQAVARGFAARRIATLLYQFPSMERGSKRPDRPAVAHATVRAAVDAAARLEPSLPLFAGGKSFGGRMTSQAQADMPLSGVLGLVFFGFPLHPAGKPSATRADHLAGTGCPMLFLQGTRDALAEIELLRPLIGRLGAQATLETIEGADHAFHCPARFGRSDANVLAAILDATAAWMNAHGAWAGR